MSSMTEARCTATATWAKGLLLPDATSTPLAGVRSQCHTNTEPDVQCPGWVVASSGKLMVRASRQSMGVGKAQLQDIFLLGFVG